MSTTPAVIDITRTMADPAPDEQFTVGSDLTGHTAHLVIEDADGTVVATIAGVVTPGASSTIDFTPNTASVATAGTYRHSVILDMASSTLRRTIITGDWIVEDRPG